MQKILKAYERLVIHALMIMMAVVLGLATLDLAWFILKTIWQPPLFLISVDKLLDVFGFFMIVIIGLELLETIMKTYDTQGAPHYEVILSVAIIAIARKVIILDLNKTDSSVLLGIAAIILALTAGYYLVKKSRPGDA